MELKNDFSDGTVNAVYNFLMPKVKEKYGYENFTSLAIEKMENNFFSYVASFADSKGENGVSIVLDLDGSSFSIISVSPFTNEYEKNQAGVRKSPKAK